MSYKMSDLSHKVFMDRYALKDKDGKALENTPEEMWKRVAGGLAKVEKKASRKKWEKEFFRVMQDFKFVPGGRVLSGAGTNFQVTYFNCFVIPSPKDSRGEIIETLKEMVEIMARGGGVGFNISSLRPRGARVKKVNGFSSGPINWAELFSVATKDIVQQAGTRRGALMLMLHDWHPDVEEFITVKEDLSKINGANLSVCLSDAFMEAVKKDKDWALSYPDLDDPMYDQKWDGDLEVWKKLGGKVKIYKTVKAKYLWDLICTAAWKSAEPGLHFLDRSNKRSNTWYFERLIATNPSLRAGTKVLTKQGIFPIEQLEGKKFLVKNLDGEWSGAECFLSGRDKELYKLTLSNGKEIYATAEHKWPVLLEGGGFGKITTDKLRAGNILPFPNSADIDFETKIAYTRNQGFMVGWLYGDGWISDRKEGLVDGVVSGVRQFSRAFQSQQGQIAPFTNIDFPLPQLMNAPKGKTSSRVFGFLFSEEDRTLSKRILEEINNLKKGKSTLCKARDNTYVIQSTSREFATNLFEMFGVDKKEKGLPSSIWSSGGEYIKGMVDALISSDGFIAKKANRIIYTSKHKQMVEDFASLLSFYGVKSSIRRSQATLVKFPNKKEYSKVYERYDLSIDGYNVVRFGKIFKISHPRKQASLERIMKEYKNSRALPDDGLIRIKAVEKTTLKENVWDICVYDDTHCFYINHCITGNCGEQPLGPWAVCNLGSMNLAAYVKDKQFDFESYAKDVRVAIRLMDNVIDETYYFLKKNEKCAKEIRRTGLGIMGLGDALIKMEIRYGSDESLPVIDKIFKTLRDNAYEVSSDIAAEKGSFPKFDKKKYLEGYHIKELPEKLREKIKKQGIRNAVLLTVAPTGTTSLISGVSSGIEPVYEFEFIRRDRLGEHKVFHPLYEEWKKDHPNEPRPEYFVSANDLVPLEHVRVQAIAQGYIDSSISKTVNAPKTHTVEDVQALYMAAYDMGLKGITYMRDGSRQGVLERVEEKKEEEKKEEIAKPQPPASPILKRPTVMNGLTYETKTPLGDAFITINSDKNNEPFELFVTIGKTGSDVAGMAEALGRMVSLVLRLQSAVAPREKIRQVIAQLSGIGGARTVGFGENRVRSLPDAMAKLLADHFGFKVNGVVKDSAVKEAIKAEMQLSIDSQSNGHYSNGQTEASLSKDDSQKASAAIQLAIGSEPSTMNLFDLCPSCGGASLAHEEGCKKCYSCGYSEC